MNWKLLAWGLVACVVLGVGLIVWPPSGPPLAIEIQQRGGKVQLVRDETLLIGVMLDGPQFGDTDATKLAQVSSLRSVSFQNSSITREALRRLLPLTGLRTLNLSHTQLVPESLNDVARFTSLQQLRLAGCSWLKDEQLASLVALQSLERLELSSPSITGAGLAHLAQLPALQELTLGECAAVGDEAVDQLASLSQLKKLTLSGTELTSRGYLELCQRLPGVKVIVPPESLKDLREVSKRGTFAADLSGFSQPTNRDGTMQPLLPGDLTVIGSLTGLRYLHLEGEITDKMFLELGPLPQLESLFLGTTLITDEGLQRLAGFPSLKSLTMFQTVITGPGLKHLKHTRSLTRLEICTQQVDEVLEYLAPLQNLDELIIGAPITEKLTLSGTELTSRGYLELCQRLPGVKVIVPPESLKDLREISKRGKFAADLSGFSQPMTFSQQTNRDGPMLPLLPGDLTVIGSLTGLRYLYLQGEITDEMFLELGPLPELESLLVLDSLITDEGLQRLAGFPSLKSLSMFPTPSLKSLSMFPTQITGSGLKHLKHTPGLTRLDIRTQQGDEVLEYLAPLQNLDELIIGAPITDEGLDRMPVLAKLRGAYFNDSRVRGPGIESLSKQPSLILLCFGRGLIDDTAIEHIAKLTSLRSVSLGGTRVTEEGRARLRKLCPAMFVVPP